MLYVSEFASTTMPLHLLHSLCIALCLWYYTPTNHAIHTCCTLHLLHFASDIIDPHIISTYYISTYYISTYYISTYYISTYYISTCNSHLLHCVSIFTPAALCVDIYTCCTVCWYLHLRYSVSIFTPAALCIRCTLRLILYPHICVWSYIHNSCYSHLLHSAFVALFCLVLHPQIMLFTPAALCIRYTLLSGLTSTNNAIHTCCTLHSLHSSVWSYIHK